MTTETRTYRGETGGHYVDGFAGFRIGQTYSLTYTREGDEVLVQLPHAPGQSARIPRDVFLRAWVK